MAVSAVTAVASIASAAVQQKNANEQLKAANAFNKQAAINTADSYGQLGVQGKEANRLALEQAIQNQNDASKAAGTVNLVAGASGAAGGSVDSMMTDIQQNKGKNLSIIMDNREIAMQDIKQQGEAIRQGGIASQDQTAIRQPSWVGVGMSVAGAAISGYQELSKVSEATTGGV